MTFRTEINIPKSEIKLDYHDKVLLLGSCFSDNIGQKLLYHKWDAVVNPFGTIYNSYSINKLIDRVTKGMAFTKDEIQYNEVTQDYFHYDLHSDFNATSPDLVIEKANNTIAEVRSSLESISTIIITLGTSYIYHHNTLGMVSNCHKVPQKNFIKQLLPIQKQVEYIVNTISVLKKHNPSIKVILTVSPVRHIKEGLSNNNLSKSILRVACQEALQAIDNATYFPSYEAIIDDLRDYRFMSRDYIHPNEEAIDYIWNLFCNTYMDQNTIYLIDKISSIKKDLAHIHSNPSSSMALKHKQSTQTKINDLKEKYTFLSERF